MTDSILITIKQLLGLNADYDAFDPPTNNASLYNAYRTELEKYESLIVYECDPHYE